MGLQPLEVQIRRVARVVQECEQRVDVNFRLPEGQREVSGRLLTTTGRGRLGGGGSGGSRLGVRLRGGGGSAWEEAGVGEVSGASTTLVLVTGS